MKRTSLSAAVALAFCALLIACAGRGPAAAYSTKQVPVFREELTDETVPLRFYNETPHIAYVSLADFYQLLLPQSSMDVAKQDDGTYLLTSHTGADPAAAMPCGSGGTAVVDVEAGTLTSPDLPAFTNLMSLVQEGMDNVSHDNVPYLQVSHVEYSSEPKPVTLDFARHGIRLYADDEGVYLPFQTASTMYTDTHTTFATFNGEKVYVNDGMSNPNMGTRDPDFTRPILGSETRPADLAEFSYAQLCFTFDYFNGCPARVSDVLGAHDLDATLESMGETGQTIKAGLSSTDLAEYLVAVDALNKLVRDGGHTTMSYVTTTDLLSNEEYEDLFDRYAELRNDESGPLAAFFATNEGVNQEELTEERVELRDSIYGDNFYLKEGNTAVIVIDAFLGIDLDRWEAYFAGEGEMPSATTIIERGLFEGMPDVAGIFLDGLTRAAEDPEVENVIIDLSNNTGGSSDALAFMASIVTGRDFIRYENTLTGQVITQHFDVDRNLDGVFDENDALVDYSDLNFAVLTSQSSYSCGNLFPLEMAEDGILLLGERSGGGSCVVEMHVNADGTTFQLSSWRGRLVDADGQDIDTGIPVNIDLVSENGGYENFYNLELLNQLMNEQFGQEELEQAA